MKSILTNIIFSLLLFNVIACNTNRNQDKETHILKKTFYSNGKLKEVISYNTKNQKDSTSTYYIEFGNSDSTLNYMDGTLTKVIYNLNAVYKDLYKNNLLIRRNIYDTMNILKYSSPLNTSNISKTKFWFKSGRVFFDQNKTDTITIINTGLPYYNRGIGFKGVIFSRLTDTSYILRKDIKFKKLKEIKIYVLVYQNLGEFPEVSTIGQLFDSISIPLK